MKTELQKIEFSLRLLKCFRGHEGTDQRQLEVDIEVLELGLLFEQDQELPND